jgi:glycosyltransferase involved in cell wall biosynthesis
MPSSPLFSVLIPSYNRPELIGKTIASVLANDFPDFEVVISDDRSPRQSDVAEAVSPFLQDTRVRLYLQSENLREAGNREFLLMQARGEWHIILCDDDMLYPAALKTIATAFSRYPGANLYAFGYTVIDERDRVAYSRRAPKPLRVCADDSRLTRELLISDAFPFWLYHPATFCSRKVVRQVIRPNPQIGIGDDIMFLIDYINAGEVLQIIPAVLMYYRKFSSRAPNLQVNQSTGELPHLISRAKMLRHLRQRSDLRRGIAEFVATAVFRERFLYCPIVWSGLPESELLPHLGLEAASERELRGFAGRHFRCLYVIWLWLRRVCFFVSTFGFAGLRAVVWTYATRFLRYGAN